MFYFEILDFWIFFYWNINTIIVVDQTCEAVLNTSFIAILKNKLLFSPKLSVKVIGWADIRRRWTEESAETGILYAGRGGWGVGKADWIFSDKEGFVLTVVSLQKKNSIYNSGHFHCLITSWVTYH